jgi:putative transposase
LRDDFGEEPLHPGHRSIRLRGYDYTSVCLYFITICSHEKHCIFGNIVDAQAMLSPLGRIVRECWVAIPLHFAGTRLHAFVIMPNHLHGIVEICAKLGRSSAAPLRRPAVQPGSLAAIVPSFKAAASKRVHEELQSNRAIWHRNYFETIVHDGEDFSKAVQYVLENPARWKWDRENRRPNRIGYPAESQVLSRLAVWGAAVPACRRRGTPLLEGGAQEIY